MFTLDGIRKFHIWTHQSLTLLFAHLDTLPAADYTKELPGFGYPSVRAQVVHLLGCEVRWVDRLQGRPSQTWEPARWPAVADARTLQDQARARTLDYLSRLTDAQLNSNAELRFSDGDVGYRTPALILHHVFTHAFHHKGQIVAMCRILGRPAPDTDLNQFE
ncbi:MAG TPA: DinB family protein [Acidobacteriaceae bacterium]|jgi:uncharacterized damage-inducible protein DinB|nr:DinB family protein [Acidobacteriaceae bacterium]